MTWPPDRIVPPLRVTRPVVRGVPARELAPIEAPAAKPPKVKPGGRARPDEPLAARCEIRAPVCSGPVVDRHHRKLRKHRGCDCRENTLDACDPCHDYVHLNPAVAYEHGWLLHSWDDPHKC